MVVLSVQGTQTMATKRTIYVPGFERSVTLGQYVKAIKLAKANPNVEFKHTLCHWWPGTGAEIMGEFWKGVQDRINEGISYRYRGTAAE
jgi:hypothetical protein